MVGWLTNPYVVRLSELLRRKIAIKDELASKLDTKERKEALSDSHAHREPRPCGLTVHPGKGCSYGCLYCYIWDMGLPKKPKPCHLSGLQLAYAIASNPYTLVGREGTFLAFGSITEPFLPEIREKTLEYLKDIRRYLGNPSQFSTKSYLDEEDARLIREADPHVSALVTIPTLKWAKKLEPKAPSPDLRFKAVRNLLEAGIHTAIFIRPLIPKVSEDVLDILERAIQVGAKGVVFGTLRVTKNILTRLEAVGITDLSSRIVRNPKGDRDQVPIYERDIKEVLVRKSRELNLKVYPSACSANAGAHNLSCYMCNMGPCGDTLPEYDPEELEGALAMIGIKAKIVSVEPRIVVYVKEKKKTRIVKHIISTATKRMVSIRIGKSRN